ELLADLDIGFHLFARWRRDLHKGDVLAQLRKELEQTAEGAQAVRKALGVVESIDANDLLTAQNAATVHFDLHLLVALLRHLVEGVDVNADGEAAGDDLAIIDLYSVAVHLVAELVLDIMLQIAEVGVGLETDDVEVEQGFNQPAMLRHRSHDLRWREGDVQEEADALGAAALAQLRGKRDQMIIVDPDDVIRLQDGKQCIGELAVHTAIAIEEI